MLQDQAQCASVSLSSASVFLTMQSQSKTIFVASNRSEIDVKCSADWLDISVEDGKIVLYADENSEVTDRLAIVDVVAGLALILFGDLDSFRRARVVSTSRLRERQTAISHTAVPHIHLMLQ